MTTAFRDRKFNLVVDKYDDEDLKFSVPPRVAAVLPPSYDGTPDCPTIRDQGPVGACTGFAAAGAHGYIQKRTDPGSVFVCSGYFPYFNARAYEGTTDEDAGASIRDVVKGIAKLGICPETLWPSVNPDMVTNKPSGAAYTEAAKHQILRYKRVEASEAGMKGCIAAGYPMILGFQVYDTFELIDETGIVTMPITRLEQHLGGHAQFVLGYDDTTGFFKTWNTWGTEFGDHGFLFFPYEYFLDPKLCGDRWMLQIVEE